MSKALELHNTLKEKADLMLNDKEEFVKIFLEYTEALTKEVQALERKRKEKILANALCDGGS